jgi:predicted nucleic-acid-binding protein
VIGVDTNVFVRFTLNDNQRQQSAALGLLSAADADNPVFIHPIVWVEAEWLLRSRYKLSREEIADRLAIAVKSDRVVMPDADACEAALEDYRASKAHLADCLIARLNAATGCTETRTFDKDASLLEGMRLLAT